MLGSVTILSLGIQCRGYVTVQILPVRICVTVQVLTMLGTVLVPICLLICSVFQTIPESYYNLAGVDCRYRVSDKIRKGARYCNTFSFNDFPSPWTGLGSKASNSNVTPVAIGRGPGRSWHRETGTLRWEPWILNHRAGHSLFFSRFANR